MQPAFLPFDLTEDNLFYIFARNLVHAIQERHGMSNVETIRGELGQFEGQAENIQTD
jgi:hypothetical protein